MVVGLAASRWTWLSLPGVIGLRARGPSTPQVVVSLGMRLTVSIVGDIYVFEVVLLTPNLEGQDDVMSDPSPTYLPGMARPTRSTRL